MNTFFPLLKSALAFAAILLAAVGQYLHTYYHADLIALVLLSIAVVLWIFVVGSSAFAIVIHPREPAPSNEPHHPIPIILAISAIVLTVFTFFYASGNQLSVDNLLAWSGSLVAFLYLWLDLNPAAWRAWLRKPINSAGAIILQTAILGGIVLIGAFFCLYQLESVPATVDTQHTDRVLAIDNVVNASYAPIFFDQIPGGEPLEFYLTAAFAKVTDIPVDLLMLKLFSAAMGILLIPLVYLLARELFGGNVALIAAFLMAISKWNVSIARMGLQFGLAPVFTTATMIFLFRAFSHQRRNDFLAAGIFLGTGVYGYSAFRIVPFLVLAFVILWPVFDTAIRSYVANCALMFALALVIAIPLLRYATEQPKQILAPMAYLIDPGTSDAASPALTLGSNLVGAAAMFNWTGNANPFNTAPNDPALDDVTGALFLLGVAYALYRLVRFRESIYAFLLIGLAILVLPSALNVAHPAENPSIVYAAGALPFAIVIAALPLAWIAQSIRTALSDSAVSRIVAVIVVSILLLISMRANFLRYFDDYASVNQSRTDIFDGRLPIVDSFAQSKITNPKSNLEFDCGTESYSTT